MGALFVGAVDVSKSGGDVESKFYFMVSYCIHCEGRKGHCADVTLTMSVTSLILHVLFHTVEGDIQVWHIQCVMQMDDMVAYLEGDCAPSFDGAGCGTIAQSDEGSGFISGV